MEHKILVWRSLDPYSGRCEMDCGNFKSIVDAVAHVARRGLYHTSF